MDPTGNASQCLKDAYLKARKAGMSKEDAYKAAKEAYKNNHTESNPRPKVDVPSDRSMTRAEWEQVYREARTYGGTTLNAQIGHAVNNQRNASKIAKENGYDAKPNKKTVATNGEITTLSGWKDLGENSEFTRVSPDDVISLSNEIGHKLKNAGANDQGTQGKYNASHAEKQLSVISSEPIGVSTNMCIDCQNYFSKYAEYFNLTQVVADPNNIRVFNPNGTIEIRSLK